VLDARERLACLRLIRSPHVGPATFRELINNFGSASAALDALPALSRRAGTSVQPCSVAEAERELEAAERAGATPLFTIEPGYPAALAMIEPPPPLLYVKGDVALLNRPAIAIVGSRQASAAGVKLARLFASALSAAGLAVVSGLARGIDAAAHEAALAHGTIAVLAGGLDVIYPPEHKALQAEIGRRGCIVTEQPPGFVPRAKDFPRRNRLISGISMGIIVVEAAHRSGTLVTARFAGEQGREVFALPGHPLDPRAEGTNGLLKAGATLVTEPQDVLDALALQLRPDGLREPPAAPLSVPADGWAGGRSAGVPEPISELDGGARERVLAALGPHPVDVDELARVTSLGAREIRILLLELDLAGEITRHGAQLVSRSESPVSRSDSPSEPGA